MQMLREGNRSTEPCTEIEKVKAGSVVSGNKNPVERRPGGGALHRVSACRDVKRQRRIVAQHRRQLKTMRQIRPCCVRVRERSVNRSIECETVSLVIVRPAVVLPDVVVVDW